MSFTGVWLPYVTEYGLIFYTIISLRWALISFSHINQHVDCDADLSEHKENIFLCLFYVIVSLFMGFITPLIAIFKPSVLSTFWTGTRVIEKS
jgi:hypothetical protein